MDDQHEEIEHIPWGELLAHTDDGRRRLLYLGAAALGVLALTVVVTRALSSSSPSSPADVETAETVASTAADAAPTTVTVQTSMASTSSTTATSAPAPVLYREIDLMALAPGSSAMAAIGRAEWFVTDYFTADLEPNGTADLRSALPGGSPLPEMPQDATAGISYVEWARAFRIEEVDDGLFEVGVVYRLLGAPPERGFQRLPVRAVEVRVAVSDGGGSVVVDLPSPTALPAGPSPEPWPESERKVPERIAEGAISAAAGWGTEHRVLEAAEVEDGWRVVLTAADELGNHWPLVVRVDGSGEVLDR
jgi:hypothetical protein